jgi:hypothetical protein
VRVVHDIGGPVHGYGVLVGPEGSRWWTLWVFLLENCVPIGVTATVKGNGVLITPFSIERLRL